MTVQDTTSPAYMYARRKEKEEKMTVKRYTNDASHSRFYVFRHKTVEVNGAPVHTNETLVDQFTNGNAAPWFGWTTEFAKGTLYSETEAMAFAAECAATGKETNDGFTYCVGKVFVEVDGHFQIQVF